MRKLFTRLFSLLALFCVLGLQMVYGVVIDRVPADGKTNVTPSTDLTLTFDYPVAQADDFTGAIIQLKNSGGAVVDAITLPSSRFVIDGSKITIDLQATLLDNTGYYVVIPNDVVKEMKPDGTSVVFAGYSASGDWNFTTGDYTAPKLATSSTFNPADGTTNVGGPYSSSNALSIKTATFTVNFNESVTGVSGKYIKVYTAAGNVHEMIDAGVYTSANTAVSFTTSNLRENSDYYILIDAGAFVDYNATASLNNKNPFAGISDKTKWNFTTRDFTPAVFAADYPAFGTIANESIALKVKLNEPANVYFHAYKLAETEVAGFAPTVEDIGTSYTVNAATAGTEYTYNYAGLEQGETYVFYYYTINKAKLLTADNKLTSAVGKTESKTTLDTTAPEVVTFVPTNNSTVELYLDNSGEAGHGTVSMLFGENVKAGAGNIILKKASDNSTVESVSITSNAVSFKSSDVVNSPNATDLVIVKFATKLASSSKYYVTIASGVITDKTGNKYAGINTATAWTFTTVDLVAPTVVFSIPAHEGVLASGEPVVLTFSEAIYNVSGGSFTATDVIRVEKNNETVTPTSVTYNSTDKTIAISVAWDQNSTYVVKLLKNSVYDVSHNAISKEVVKSYTTDSYDSPKVRYNSTGTTYADADGATISKNPSDNLVVRFSEPVELYGGGAITNANVGNLINLNENAGDPVEFVATYSSSTRDVTINPVADLKSGSSYTLNISDGYQDFNLIDGANQGLPATVTYNVADKVSPVATFDFVKTNVPTVAGDVNLVVKFSESLAADPTANQVILRVGDVNGTVAPLSAPSKVINADGTVSYTFHPSVDLKEGITYYLALAGGIIEDAAHNKVVGVSTTFVTKTTPTLVSSVPAQNAENVVKTTSSIALTYSENIKLNTATTGSNANGAAGLTVDPDTNPLTANTVSNVAVEVLNSDEVVVAYATASDLVFLGSAVSFNLTWVTGGTPSPYVFASGETYDVLVDGSYIASANNNIAGLIDLGDLEFSIIDYSAPVLTSLSAPAAADPNDAAVALKLTFSDDKVKKGSGSIVIQRVDIANQPQTVIDVNSTAVTINSTGHEVSISHAAFIPATANSTLTGTPVYKVTVSNGAFTDLAGNKFAGLVNDVNYLPGTITVGQNVLPYADAAGTATVTESDFTPITANKAWYFSTAQNDVPAFVANLSSPIPGTDRVGLTADLVIAFDEAIAKNSNTATVTVSANNNIAQQYAMAEQNVSFSGNNINVALQNLTANTEYTVTLDAGAVKDIYGDVNNAITGTTFQFNTGSTEAPVPTVVVNGTYKATPDAGDPNWTMVKRNSNIVINFDEAVRNTNGSVIGSSDIPGNIVSIVGNSSLADNGITEVIPSFTANISADKKTITVDASSFNNNLTSFGLYDVVVNNVEDVDGNAMASAYRFTFKVDDYTAPVGQFASAGVDVIENYKGTEIKVNLDYDEDAVAYYLLLPASDAAPTKATVLANGTAVTVDAQADPVQSLVIATTPQTKYNLWVVAQDVVNSTSQADVEGHEIRTADITAPTVAEFVDNGKLDVDPAEDFDITIKFADKVQSGSGYAYLFDSNNVLVQTIATSSSLLASDTDNKELTLTVSAANIEANKSYYLIVDKGFVTDVWASSSDFDNADDTHPFPAVGSGSKAKTVNKFAGFSNVDTYKFSTLDDVVPTISSINVREAGTITYTGGNYVPSTSVNADPNSNLVITFKEGIKLGAAAGSGDIKISDDHGNLKELILANSSKVTIAGSVLTINPGLDFVENNGLYNIAVKAGVIEDLSGNPNSEFNWNIAINDIKAPTVDVSVLDANDELIAIDKAPVRLDSPVYFEFSEAVRLLDNSAFITDDLDTLVTLVDGAKKAVKFTTETTDADNFRIIPTGDWKSNTDYTLSFGQVFEDVSNNAVPAQTVKFTTKIGVSPTVMFDPTNASVDVAKDKTITVTFSRGIVQEDPTGSAATGYFSALENSELKDYFSLQYENDEEIAFTATISTNKRVVTIKPVIALASSSVVKLGFNFGEVAPDLRAQSLKSANLSIPVLPALVDSLNNQVMANPDDVEFTDNDGISGYVQFDVVDYAAPILAGDEYAPNEADYLNSGNKLSIEFNEKVKAGTGDIKIYRKDGTLVETIAASTLTTKSDNSKVILINPSAAARENNMEYYVLIPSGAIVDLSPLANPFAGTVDYTTWTYSTADNQIPVVTSLSPASGSTDVYVYDNLVVTFDKKVKLGTGNIAIYKKGGDAFDLLRVSTSEYRIKLDPSGLFATIDFTNTLAPETEYYVEVEAGTFANAKNPDAKFAGIMTNTGWTFSTEVTFAPKVIANGLVPADNATAIPVGKLVLGMTFDREVMKGSGVVKLIETATGTLAETVNISDAVVAGTNATITFLNPLKANTDYHVIVEAGTVTNTLPSKVAYAGITSPSIWNFTTVTDVTAPKLLTWTPNATTLTTEKNHPTLVMTFDEALVFGAGNVKIVKKSDNVTALTIPVTAAMVTDKTVTVTYSVVAPATGLDQNTDYYVLVDAGIVKDAAGNATAAITDVATGTFKTGADFATPVVKIDDSLEFKVYPNPFVDFVTVSNASELTKVVVSNIAGQVVKEVVNPESTIQLSELRSGVYFMSLYQGNAVIKTVKILKR